MATFYFSFIVTISAFIGAYWYGHLKGLLIVIFLSLMEISISFDNAIVNATVLKKMSVKWQTRFLTWGIFIAVFVVRFLLPLLLVSLIANLSLKKTITLAVYQPEVYSAHLTSSHATLACFGGIFLFLVFLSFFLNQAKKIHWLKIIENQLLKIGRIGSIEVFLALLLLLCTQYFILPEQRLSALVAGSIAIMIFILLSSLNAIMDQQLSYITRVSSKAGLLGFIYLEVLDTSFSFDGVIGAFAITKDLVLINLGLMVGAIFVRSLTIQLVRHKTLDNYLFLEHGAHYAIGALSLIMLLSLKVHVPELLTGLIGFSMILISFIASKRHTKNYN